MRHGSAASLLEGILFLRVVFFWLAVGSPESVTGRDMASYATASRTNSIRPSCRQYQGIFIINILILIFRCTLNKSERTIKIFNISKLSSKFFLNPSILYFLKFRYK